MANKAWSTEEKTRIIDSYRKVGPKPLALELGRSVMAVRMAAGLLGLEKDRAWSNPKDVVFLKENYATTESEVLAKLLGYTPLQIQKKANQLGLLKSRIWTPETSDKLIELAPKHTAKELVEILGFEQSYIRRKSYDLGIKIKTSQVKNSGTFPERQVEKVLTQLGITFSMQEVIRAAGKGRYYRPDFVLPEDVIVEVQGDYFHCNPIKYPEGPKDSIQRRNVKRDAEKREAYASLGYTLFEVWESDCQDSEHLAILIRNLLSPLYG